MPRLFASLNRIEIHHLRNLLEVEGIACFVRNDLLSQLAGEVPFGECQPELWLKNEADRDRAEAMLRNFLNAPVPQAQWRCGCGEWLEGQFTACWHCGSFRNGS